MNNWNTRANDIFAEAALIEDAEAQKQFLEIQCGLDAALRVQVDALLKAHQKAPDFLNVPVMQRKMDETEPVKREMCESVVGPYRLLQKIGEGGFGVVYMAEQKHPIRRKVAIKIIKPGMDTREVLARFEAERQALAMMDHPNIAKILDAGTTKLGRPYFAMELVKGVPITHFCDENQLSTRERLELFVTICRAVQHAHQKGVIHRDLKPANVMVTVEDDGPTPKVIDFGVAKAINQELTEKTLFTAYGQMVGTPQYMSPEQAKISGIDIDTRSDVYSLGVLLYELLTGATPIDVTRLRSSGFDEMRRIIQEEDAPKPSDRLSRSGEMLPDIADQRGTVGAELQRVIRGELDWIVMKAIDKDRRRRYETAVDFANDLQRHMRGDVVEAVAPTTSYRLRKWFVRHRFYASTAILVATTLFAATLFSVWQARIARSAQKNRISTAPTLSSKASSQISLLLKTGDSLSPNRNSQKNFVGVSTRRICRERFDT